MKEPHLADPIYFYYKGHLEDSRQAIDKTKVEIESTNAHIENTSTLPGERREYLETLFEQKKKLEKLQEQKLFYFQKLTEQIKKDASEYKKAYESKKPWPNPDDFKAFNLEIGLKDGAGKEWSAEKRVKDLSQNKKETDHEEKSEHH